MRRNHISVLQWSVVAIIMILMYKFIERESLIEVIRNGLPPMEAGLIEGIVLGSKEGMTRDFYENLKVSGLVHLVVASGSNMILISNILIEQICPFLGRKKTVVLGLAGMWRYAFLVGWQAPIVRAGVFLSLKYMAQLWGRQFEWKRGLAVTIALMMAADYTIITSISFWMSVTAFVAISLPRPKWKLMTETVWVSIWLLPLLAYSFGEISLIAPISNLMVLFLVEVISLVGGVASILGLIWKDLAEGLFYLLVPMLKYFIWVVRETGSFGMLPIKFNLLMVVGYYFILINWYRRRQEDE